MSHDRYHAVLIADDPRLLDGLRTAFRAEPYDVHTAGDATDAVKLFSSIRPEVIVSDFQLPGMLGTELLSHARIILPDSCRILMTGSPSLSMAVNAINQGAITRLFLKPFQIIDLVRAVREAMERAETSRLTQRLLVQAQKDRQLLQRIQLAAPELLIDTPHQRTVSSGSVAAEDYLPHDSSGVLQALRLLVA